MYSNFWKLILVIYLSPFVIAQYNFTSPCPRLFVYDTARKEPNMWFGSITMISDDDTSGAFPEIHLDRPALQLGNWYGMVYTEDNKKYIIANAKDPLTAHVPKVIRFFVKYDSSKPPPRLVAYHLNAKRVCPEEKITEVTNRPLKVTTSPNKETLNKSYTVQSSQDDEFFMSDLSFLINSLPKPNITKGDICGTIVTGPQSFNTDGQQTNEGEFPWHVALYQTKGTVWSYICGASLISKDFVITAAHCVTEPFSSKPLNPNNLITYLGKLSLKSFSNRRIQERQISEIIIHPQYNGLNYTVDITLLKLALPAEFTDYVRPICLWQESPDLKSLVDKQGKMVGWGSEEDGMVPDQLVQAEMTVISVATCLDAYPHFYTRLTSENTFCAGYRNDTSVCNGNAGNGLVFPKSNYSPSNPIWQLRGVVSIGAAANNQFKCDASLYIVFTDTAKYLDWIKNKIK